MPFRVWNPWRSQPPSSSSPAGPSPASLSPENEAARLAADPRVHRLFDWFLRHEREIADFQMAITTIPAPPFAEQVRADWLRLRLQSLGLAPTSDAAGNLLAARPGAESAPAIALSAHLDTVFPADTPLDIRREHTRLLGPGISDNGSGLAALWALASAFDACGIHTLRPLLFVANTGEEGEGNLRGVRHLYRRPLAATGASVVADDAPPPEIAALIALDGAGCDRIIAQALGSRRFLVTIRGAGGHSWSDHGTPNPIYAAALAVAELYRLPLPTQPRTTLNVGSIAGGASVNTIPESVVFKVDMRSSERHCLDALEQQMRRAVVASCAEASSAAAQPGLRLSHAIALTGERPAGELPDTSPLLAAVRAVDVQLGIRSEVLRASTDANIPLSLGLPALTLGAGGSGGRAHTLQEWFDPTGRAQGLRRLALVLLLLAGLPQAAEAR